MHLLLMNRMHLSHWVMIWMIIQTNFSWKINGCFFSESFPVMEPNKNKIVPVNETVTITCEIGLHGKISLFLNNTLVKTNTSYIKYNFTSIQPEVSSFTCKYNNNENKLFITSRYAPRLVSLTPLITGLQFCTLVVNFTVAHFTKKDYISICRYDNKTGLFTFCEDNVFVYEILCNYLVEYIFQVKISATDLKKNITYNTIMTQYQFYKLQKLNLIVHRTSSESLMLSYDIRDKNRNDKSIRKNMSCLYRIIYKSEFNQTKTIITNETEFLLENLVPYTTYTINVQAKFDISRYWSDNVMVAERTLSSAPYAGPKSTNGSYWETACKERSKRCFIIFWDAIPLPQRNGIFDCYIIQRDNKILLKTSEIYAQINDQPQNEELRFEILMKNNNSQVSPPTFIHIPPNAPEKPRGVSIVKLNETHVNISWALKQSVKDVTVTVMSCLGVKSGSVPLCKSNMMWTKIQNKNFTIMKTQRADFLAAAYVSNSKGSSSLTFAECILIGGISKPPSKPIIGERGAREVNLWWPSFHCKDLIGKPILFQVLYAEGNSCNNGSKLNITAVGVKPEIENVDIKNLKPFTKYSICLRIQTEQDWSQESHKVEISTAETYPGSSVRNPQFVNYSSTSVTLKWNSTLQPNGIITHQIIHYGENEMYSNASNNATVQNLNPSTEYNFTISTCNKVGCSVESSYITVKTLEKSSPILVIIITLVIILSGIVFISCVCFIKRIKGEYDDMKIDVEFPDSTLNDYVYIDSALQSLLIDGKSHDVISTKNKQVINFAHDNTNNSNSREALKLDHSSESLTNLDENVHLQRELPPLIFSQANLDSNDYVKDDNMNLSELNHFKSDYNHYGHSDITSTELNLANLDSDANILTVKPELNEGTNNSNEHGDNFISILELNQANMDSNDYIPIKIITPNFIEISSNVIDNDSLTIHSDPDTYVQNNMNSTEFSQSDSDSNGYVQNKMNTSESSQGNSDSNGYVQNKMNTSESSQGDSDSNGYVQNKMNTSESSQGNSDSNGYVQNNMDSSEFSQSDSDSNGYVQNKMNTSESSQGNSDSNGYVQNKMNTSESSQGNSDSNGYVQNNMDSSKFSQGDSDCNGYVQNKMNTSESSQGNSDSNAYVQNKMNTSDSSQGDSDSNGYVQNKMNTSESSQGNSDSNGYVQNNMDSSEFSQGDSDSNGYVQNKMNTSESSQGDSDSNGYVQNKMNTSESSQGNSDSNGYVQNNMDSSKFSQGDSDSNGYVQNKMNTSESSQGNSDSNAYVQNNMDSSEFSQSDSDSNGYVQNKMNTSESSQGDSDSNGYVQNKMNTSESSQGNSDSNGYVQNNMDSSEFSQGDSDCNGYVQNKMNTSESSQGNSDSNGYVQNNMDSSKFSKFDLDSNGYVQNKMNTSELNQTNPNSDNHGHNHTELSLWNMEADCNGYVYNMKSSEFMC